jgi:hypothetical protein
MSDVSRDVLHGKVSMLFFILFCVQVQSDFEKVQRPIRWNLFHSHKKLRDLCEIFAPSKPWNNSSLRITNVLYWIHKTQRKGNSSADSRLDEDKACLHVPFWTVLLPSLYNWNCLLLEDCWFELLTYCHSMRILCCCFWPIPTASSGQRARGQSIYWRLRSHFGCHRLSIIESQRQ